MIKKRKPFEMLLKRLQEPRRFIQCLIGPRQVGKTTLARQVADELARPSRYVSADLATLQDTSWLQQQWDIARELAKAEGKAVVLSKSRYEELSSPRNSLINFFYSVPDEIVNLETT